jgi:hypothetical protein
MKKAHFLDIIARPELLDEDTLPALTEIVEEFPWFQSARMLLVKNLHVLDHVRFNGELKQASAFIADRKLLFELIHRVQAIEEVEEEVQEQEEKVIPTPEKVVSEDRKEQVVSDISEGSSVRMTASVSSVNEYFQTDDVFETNEGESLDFSAFTEPKEKEPVEMQVRGGLLDYETSSYSGYELQESIDPEEDKDSNRSFSDWLTVLKHAPVEKEEFEPVKKKSQQIIDNFLNLESPKIIPVKSLQDEEQPHKTKVESQDDDDGDDLMSETLASIYIKQKHYDKAIAIYEKLRLKYPEKNAYFAQRISDLEK